MHLTIDFKNAYISPDGEINDVLACYSKTGKSAGKLITLSNSGAQMQGPRRKGGSVTNHRQHSINEAMALLVIKTLIGKDPVHQPRDRGWSAETVQAFSCEPKRKTFLG